MPEDESENNEDKILFEYYLSHGHFPDVFLNKNNNIAKNEKTSKTKPSYSKGCIDAGEMERFIKAIENLDCSNHIKKSGNIKTPVKKFKPNIKDVKPKSVLDLHGLSGNMALHIIRSFISESIKNYESPVLIIHGKGFRSENGRGVLKDIVEYYIATEGKNNISYSCEAPINLGGRGAKLIYLSFKK